MVSKRSNTSNTWKLETTGNHWKPLETTASRMRKVYRLWGGDEISCGCMGRALQLKVMVLGGYRTWQGPWSLATWPPWHGPWRHDAMTPWPLTAWTRRVPTRASCWPPRDVLADCKRLMQNWCRIMENSGIGVSFEIHLIAPKMSSHDLEHLVKLILLRPRIHLEKSQSHLKK